MFIRRLALGDDGKCHIHQIKGRQEGEIKANMEPSEAHGS